MRSLFIVVAAVMSAMAVSAAQDAIKSLPDNYVLQFENEYVRVTRVHYPPHARLAAHSHTALASAYVYLNDGGPVAFKHIGAKYGAATRPATKAGSFRLYRGLDEIHEVENLSPLPSDFLRVEFKTDPGDPSTLRGKFLSEPGGGPQTVQFENAQVRILRLRLAPGQTMAIRDTEFPSLLISLVGPRRGQVRWLAAGATETWTAPPSPREQLQIAFKTPPETR